MSEKGENDLEALLEQAGEEWRARAADGRRRSVADGVVQAVRDSGSGPSHAGAAWTTARLRLAAVFVAAVVLVASGLAVHWATRPSGAIHLVAKQGDVRIDRGGQEGTAIEAGAVLDTGARGSAIVTLDDGRVQCYMARNTAVAVVSSGEVRLDSGRIWVNVRTDSGRFDVRAPGLDVVVTGTRFAVSVEGGEGRVFVVEGSVSASSGGSGQSVGGGSLAAPRPGGGVDVTIPDAPPAWVGQTRAEFEVLAATRYFPSGNLSGNAE